MTQPPAGPPNSGPPSAYPLAPPPSWQAWGPPTATGTTQAWPPPPPTAPAYAIEPPRPAPQVWGVLASAGVIVVVLCHFYALSRVSRQIALVDNMREGAPVSIADATSADHAVSVASGLTVITGLLAVVLVMTWAYRARTNSAAYTASEFRRSRGWAIGGWICPVVALWFPYQVVKDIWTASDTSRPNGLAVKAWQATALLPVWWTCLIAGAAIGWLASSLYSTGMDEPLESSGPLHTSIIFDYMSAGFDIAAAITFIVIVATVSRFQSQRHQWFTQGEWPR